MGIDGIGRGGGIPPGPGSPGGPGGAGGPGGPDGPGRSGPAGAAGKEFSPNPVDAAEGVSGAERSEALGKLEKGELSLDEYLDGQVQEATQHLEGRISPEQLEAIRQTLRDEMSSDPVLVELVQRATGKVPEASDL